MKHPTMNFEEFEAYQIQLFYACKSMGTTKGKEYAHDVDRFANFNRLATELDLPPIKVAFIFLKKHLDSIASFVKEGRTFSTEPIEGRFVDAIVYMTLIAGMIKATEEQKNVEPKTCDASPKST